MSILSNFDDSTKSISFFINLITSFNTIRLGLPPNNTYVLDLQKSEKEIYNNLKSNWRNGLKKGLRLTKVEEVNDPKKINSILEEYKNYAKKMNFKQISYKIRTKKRSIPTYSNKSF